MARRRRGGRLPAASLASLRWALAFHGGFLFVAVGMAAATWWPP